VPMFQVTRKSRPKALAELVSEASLHEAWMLAMGRRLHDDYSVPWDVLMSMDVKNRERLLKSILSRAAEDAPVKDAGHPCVWLLTSSMVLVPECWRWGLPWRSRN